METVLTATLSKWVSQRPLWPGDLINNMGLYWPIPDYNSLYYKRLAVNAENYTIDGSRAKWNYADKAMFYCPASSGWRAYQIAQRYPDKIKESSRRFTAEGDEAFLTVQRISDALDPQIMQADVFAWNYRVNENAVELAAQAHPDTYIIGPADREGHLRALSRIHSMLGGARYEDVIFEAHMWGPLCLLDATRGIYHGDHAWSRNAAMEKAVALVVQYGAPLPLMVRRGVGYDVTDIAGRPVPIADQAWEDSRHIVDVVERGFRSEAAVTLLLTRFMYDHYYRTNAGDLERDRVHDTVKAHYTDAAELARMQTLRDVMLPYLADRCDWPTLRGVLDQDPALKEFWATEVAPLRGQAKPAAEIQKTIFAYLPRGGFDHPEWRTAVTQRRDPPLLHNQFFLADKAARNLGVHEDPFSHDLDPKLFNDRNFARLGGTKHPDRDPDPDHYTVEQNTALMIVNAYRDGRPPLNAPRTLLYLDDPASGLRPAAFLEAHQVDHPGEVSAIFDPLARGGDTFQESVTPENAGDFSDRVREIACQKPYQDWRRSRGVGAVIALSDFAASARQRESRREAINAEMHQGVAADGPLKISGAAVETAVRRYIDIGCHGMIIPGGEITDRLCRYVIEGVVAAIGKAGRPYSGGKYQFEFFMDHDYAKAPEDRRPPEKCDLGDLILHIGMKVKADLESDNPPALTDRYVSLARLLDVYEKLSDPGRCNVVTERDPHSGADREEKIVDWNQVDPTLVAFSMYDPGLPDTAAAEGKAQVAVDHPDYRAFVADPDYRKFSARGFDVNDYVRDADGHADPARKAKLVKMMWFWMRAAAVPLTEAAGYAPVTGNLLARGIHAFDTSSLRDLPDEYRKARDWWQNLSGRERTNIFRQGTIHVEGPGITVR